MIHVDYSGPDLLLDVVPVAALLSSDQILHSFPGGVCALVRKLGGVGHAWLTAA